MEIGKVYTFGKNAKNVVTRVIPLAGHVQFQAQVYLRGSRGGEYLAFVRHDGSVRKV